MNRLATAPISWGICEVPGWGVQLPVDRVLSEMRELGFPATELGSEGYLPLDPSELNSVLASHELTLLAAFVPLVIHEPTEAEESLKQAKAMAARLQACGAKYFNTAPVTTWDWGPRTELSEDQWAHVAQMFDKVEEICNEHGLLQVLHTHVGCIVETKVEVDKVLEISNVKFVLDTAHLAVGGFDPFDFVKQAADRVGLVHIKDADMKLADKLNAGEMTLMEAVQGGIFPPVGQGNLDIEGIITHLEGVGYDGWYVLEQDIAITGDEPPQGSGPVLDVQTSVKFLQQVEGRLTA